VGMQDPLAPLRVVLCEHDDVVYVLSGNAAAFGQSVRPVIGTAVVVRIGGAPRSAGGR
jgi:hypothetical protein